MTASTSRDDRAEGVTVIYGDDGTVTARDLETGLARGGDTRSEALSQRAAVLALEAGRGEPVTDPGCRAWCLPDDNLSRVPPADGADDVFRVGSREGIPL